ncbi:MAG: DUF4494 domain-containing protein [Bacteroidales bacterium]|nr:DUF4494 domain-containing protein [Bacteroidales bacterium]MCM1147322.1 DUF4494 domain-containing protein [Bacteroidales bacterium]MCM1206244.1 DUF4494 domain-containing protein [Bacillota bacterium]
MRSRTATWFETKVRYEKTMEDGSQKKVVETNVVDAVSFTEAEKRTNENVGAFISGEFSIIAEKIASYHEVFFSDNECDDKWYKAKLQFITLDEKTSREKRSTVYYLVQAHNIDNAKKYIKEFMDGTMNDYEIMAISDTPIMDVYEYKQKTEENNDTSRTD